MKEFLPVMSGDYKKKNYGEGIFKRVHKNTATVSYLIYIFFGVILAGGVYLAFWSMKRTATYDPATEGDMIMIGHVMTVIFTVFALIGLACIIITLTRHMRREDSWRAKLAKNSGYTVEEIKKFEHQALEKESRVISLLSGPAKAMAGQMDGILTEDYVFLSLTSEAVVRYTDLKAAVIMEQSVRAKSNTMEINYLVVGLIGKGGTSSVAECTKESGRALINYLKEKCPDLYTADGEIIRRDEYDEIWKKVRDTGRV